MLLWRISRHRDLSGMGGLKAAARWHYAGHAIVYLAETPASALLEVCVHTSATDVPPAFTLLKIKGPDLEVPSITIDTLPKDWQAQLEVPLCPRRSTFSSIHHTSKPGDSASPRCFPIHSTIGSRRSRTLFLIHDRRPLEETPSLPH
jgi:hypothetical protein